jgi:hypothetical protein
VAQKKRVRDESLELAEKKLFKKLCHPELVEGTAFGKFAQNLMGAYPSTSSG